MTHREVNKVIAYPTGTIYKGEAIYIPGTAREEVYPDHERHIVPNRKIGSEWKDYIRHGYGHLYNKNGVYYIGDFADDQKNGKGKMTYPDLGSYEGKWKDNNPFHKGEITWLNGAVYIGEIIPDIDGLAFNTMPIANGNGMLVHYNGQIDKGIFRENGIISGNVVYSPTGDTFEGTFYNEVPHAPQRDGRSTKLGRKEGKMIIKKYLTYTGGFDPWGDYAGGIINYSNGDTYSGNFKSNLFDGTGIFYDSKNKREYRGNWKNGSMLPNQHMRSITLGRSGMVADAFRKINITNLTKEADRNVANNIYKPAPYTLYNRTLTVQTYISNISDKLEEFKILEKDEPELYKDKPVAYFTIRAHGAHHHGETKIFLNNMAKSIKADIDDSPVEGEKGYNAKYVTDLKATLKDYNNRIRKLKGLNPYEGEQDRFIVPDGVRLIFLDNTLHTLSLTIDKFLFNPDFYRNSLIDRSSYSSISPVTLFSTIRNNTAGSISKIDICKFLNNNVIPSTFTNIYTEWKLSNRAKLYDKLKKLGVSPLQFLNDFVLSCSNSISDSGMECSNLTLSWTPYAGHNRVKIGIYPLPNDRLWTETQNPKSIPANKTQERDYKWQYTKAFDNAFMPENPNLTEEDVGKFYTLYQTRADDMWKMYGNKASELKDFVISLPRGTIDHPCVYFMVTCRGVHSDSVSDTIDMDVVKSLRTHSDTVQASYDVI